MIIAKVFPVVILVLMEILFRIFFKLENKTKNKKSQLHGLNYKRKHAEFEDDNLNCSGDEFEIIYVNGTYNRKHH